MCLALLRPDKDRLEVDYLLETIYLRGTTKTFLTVDLFLRNPTSKDVKTLYVAYPNRAFKHDHCTPEKQAQLRDNQGSSAATLPGYYYDRSFAAIANGQHPDEHAYSKCNLRWEQLPLLPDKYMLQVMERKLPPFKEPTFETLAKAERVVQPVVIERAPLDDEAARIVEAANFSLFHIELHPGSVLKANGGTRCFRWVFAPLTSCMATPWKPEVIWRWFSDPSIHTSFQTFGPLETMDEFQKIFTQTHTTDVPAMRRLEETYGCPDHHLKVAYNKIDLYLNSYNLEMDQPFAEGNFVPVRLPPQIWEVKRNLRNMAKTAAVWRYNYRVGKDRRPPWLRLVITARWVSSLPVALGLIVGLLGLVLAVVALMAQGNGAPPPPAPSPQHLR